MPAAPIVKSAGRAFEVLELFRQERRPLSGSEVCKALDYPKSSTNALMRSLVSLGYVVLDPRTRRFFPSLSITQLGDWIPSCVLSSNDAFEVLSEIHAATRETVTLSVKDDLQCRFLRVLPGTYPISLSMTEGYTAPLFNTAVGSAILAQLDDDEIVSLVERFNMRSRRKATRLESATVLADIHEIRDRGNALFFDALFPDTGAIAVPFPSDMKAFPMAIGVGGLRERINKNAPAILRSIRTAILRHAPRAGRRPRPPSRPRTAE